MHERTNRYATIRRPLGDPISSHRMQPDVAGVSVICCLLGLIAFVTFKVLNITYSTASSSLPAPKVTSFQEPRHMKHAAPCQRYAYLTGPREGFGHMMSQLALTYIYALEKNATMVIDKSKFMVPGKHGVYRWINEVLDLHDIADIHSLNAQQLRLTSYNEQLWHQHSHHAACNVFYTSCDTCCNFFNRETLFGNVASYCYYNKPSLFQLAKPFFLPRYRGTAPSRIPQLLGVRAAGRIDVVWHVRVGDITLSQNTEASVVANVMQQLQESFPPLTNFSLIIISEQSISDIPVYKNSFEPFEPVLWLSELDARQALEHMVEASVLVTSGSAFASVATLFKRSDASIALQFLAKEQVSGVYDVYDHAIVDRNGTILYPSPDQLKRRCENIVQHNVKLLNATRSILEA